MFIKQNIELQNSRRGKTYIWYKRIFNGITEKFLWIIPVSLRALAEMIEA
jgi:hypothetical protein